MEARTRCGASRCSTQAPKEARQIPHSYANRADHAPSSATTPHRRYYARLSRRQGSIRTLSPCRVLKVSPSPRLGIPYGTLHLTTRTPSSERNHDIHTPPVDLPRPAGPDRNDRAACTGLPDRLPHQPIPPGRHRGSPTPPSPPPIPRASPHQRLQRRGQQPRWRGRSDR